MDIAPLPPLSGSPDRIEAAERIRIRALGGFSMMLAMIDSGRIKPLNEAATSRIKAIFCQTEPAFWIDRAACGESPRAWLGSVSSIA